MRREQIALVLAEARSPALIVGDTNFGDRDPVQPELPSAWTDAAWAFHQQERPTYDMEGNPLARQTASPGEASRRLDRFLASPGVGFSAYAVQGCLDSDHQPIIATIVLP